MRLARPRIDPRSLVGSALALTLGAGVAAATVLAPAPAPASATLASADGALAPEPLADTALVENADRSRKVVQAAPVPVVAPLSALRAPDLLVTLPSSLTPDQLAALSAVKQVEAVAVLDAGTVRVSGREARVVGVDPSEFRAFTPRETASSDPLWAAVARGELAPAHSLARDAALELGSTVTVDGATDLEARIGAVAAYGLPGVDLVTDRAVATSLGVVPSSAVLVSAPDRGIGALRKAVRAVLGDAEVEVLRPVVAAPKNGRPTTYRELYIDSARFCPGLSWTILAAIGQVESAHGRHLGPSSAGALGPMQFLPSTWEHYGVDGDGDGERDIMSPYDAVPSAASYLCRHGATRGPDGLYDAIFAYNHADWYVKKVLGVAAQYK